MLARSAVRSSPQFPRYGRRLSDAAKKRDPTRSNDIRRRISTELRRNLALWRSQVYAAVVEGDQFGYGYGEVDPDDAEDLADRLDTLLHRQAEFAFTSGADTLDNMLRTAYVRGVRRAGEEVSPVLPLTGTTSNLIDRARGELEGMLEGQIEAALSRLREDQQLAEEVSASRYKLYTLLLLPVVLKPLQRRLQALSTTNVTRAFNAGKLDAYEVLGIEEVGVEAETQPARAGRLQRLVGATFSELTETPIEELSDPAIEKSAEMLAEGLIEKIAQSRSTGYPGAGEPEPLLPEGRRWQPPAPRTVFGIPTTKPPWMPQEYEEPEGEPVLPLGRHFPETYTVETVGDDRVCGICQNYEGNTYTLDEARALIPAHPNCRCSIVPLT